MGPSDIKLQQKLENARELACEYREPKIFARAQVMSFLWAYEKGAFDWEICILSENGNVQAMSSPSERLWKWEIKLEIERLVA